MKDLLLSVHVVFKTLNLEISRCHLADYAARAVRLFLLIQPIRSLFSGVVVTVAVVLALPNMARPQLTSSVFEWTAGELGSR